MSIEFISSAASANLHPIEHGSEQERLEVCDYVESNPDYHTDSAVVDEVRDLVKSGFDVAFTDPLDPHGLDPETQSSVDGFADYLVAEGKTNGRAAFLAPEAMGAWAPLTKRAIALHPLYNASTALTLGEGIDPAIYDMPLFDGKSAAQITREEKAAYPAKAEAIIDSYRTFVETPIDDMSRVFYQGSMDGRAVRTRAFTTASEVESHFAERGIDHPLVSASLACGAAGPVAGLVKSMEAKGAEFGEVILVDKDQMALASAVSLTAGLGIGDKVRVERKDLLAEPLTNYVPEHSVDVVDLLGLFEYIPNNERMPMAQALLQGVSQITRPGGVIVFGNMLTERPQQAFFKDIVQWPRLEQRTVRETLSIIQAAGFDMKNVKVRIPAKEGVYAVYTIAVPDETKPESSMPVDAAA